MHAATGPANDRLQDLGFLRNVGIAGGAALGGSAISEQARSHAAKLAIPSAMTGRHAAPVLHDPGTSTMVGPVPHSS